MVRLVDITDCVLQMHCSENHVVIVIVRSGLHNQARIANFATKSIKTDNTDLNVKDKAAILIHSANVFAPVHDDVFHLPLYRHDAVPVEIHRRTCG